MLSASKNSFIERIRIYTHALNHQILIDGSLTDIDHNERARFLRNGLAITAFNILEDFIKNRIGEIFTIISNSGRSFNNLPERIQEIALVNSLRGIQILSKRKKDNNEDWKLFIQEETGKISSTAASPFSISPYSIGWDKSNLGKGDIVDYLACFKVGDVWNNINKITRRIGQTISFPDQFFHNAALRRHSAAHDPNAVASFTDLEAYGLSVAAFAFAFDVLLSQSARFILDNNSDYMTTKKKISETDIKLRFIKKVNSQYKEMSLNNTISIANFSTMNDAILSIRSRRNYNNEFIVVNDSSSNFLYWVTGF